MDRAQAPQSDAAGNRLFTGKELESTGLYDLGARLYDPLSGRFSQADEIQIGPGPQAQNRYSYVLNNPLAMVDPTGHAPISSVVFDWFKKQHLPSGGGLPAAFYGDAELLYRGDELYQSYQPFRDQVDRIVKRIPEARFEFRNQPSHTFANESTRGGWEEVDTPHATLTKKGGHLITRLDVAKIKTAGPALRTVDDVLVHAVQHVDDATRFVVEGGKVKTAYSDIGLETWEPAAYNVQQIYRQYVGLGVGPEFFLNSGLAGTVTGRDWLKGYVHYLSTHPDAGVIPLLPEVSGIRPTGLPSVWRGPLP